MIFDYEKIAHTLDSLKRNSSFEEIYAYVKWNRKHSALGKEHTIAKRFFEFEQESIEAKEALSSGNLEEFAEEIGDVYYDLLFLFALLEEKGFDINSILQGRMQKQVRRAPQVFEPRETTLDEELAIWKIRKKLEKEGRLKGFGFPKEE